MDAGAAVVEFLVDVSVRSLPLAAAAWAAIGLLRVRSAAGRHAVWTLTTAAMLLTAVLRPVLPPLTLRVLRPGPAEPAVVVSTVTASVPVLDALPAVEQTPATQPVPHRAPIDWRQAAAAVYGAGVLVFAALLAASYGFTRRLARASRKVDCPGADDVYESDWIAVPMTVGLAHPKILLPADWREWPAEKLDAAMAHERMHVRRADWAVALLAGLNGCLFWFHPLAWWLRRRLAALAEQACDDATLLELGGRECYAQTLLDMTAAVRSGRGRMVWEAMAMARTAEVRNRIERILDETREIPRGWSRARWMAVAACSLPLFYMTVAVRVTAAQEVPPAPAANPQPQGPRRVDVPGTDMERRLVKKVEPVYPPEAIQAGIQGDVIFETVVGADGHVKSARPVSGNPLLREAAQAAVLQYVYRTQGAEIGSTATVAFRLPVEAGGTPATQNPVVIYKKEGEYTEEARRAGVNGNVEMEFVVGVDGLPSDIRVVRSSSPLLEKPAVEALSQGRFKPASLNGVPVAKKTKASMTFRLLQSPVRLPEGDAAPSTSGGQIGQPVLVYRREPEYPKLARQMGQSGVVELEAIIGVDGRVKGVKVLKGPPMLQRAAQDAVMHWVYQPTLVDGVAVENETHTSITFASKDPPPAEAVPEKVPDHPQAAQAAGTEATPPKAPPGRISPAVLVYERNPEYPKEAQQKGAHGTVELLATIGTDGRVRDAKVIKAADPALGDAALEAVRQWVYKPTMLNGAPVENETHISISFASQVTAAPEPPGAGTATPPAAASPAPAAAPEPPQGFRQNAILVYKVDPVYPKEARQMGVRGVVQMVATIGTDGHVRDVMVVKSPNPALAVAAVEAVRQWVYRPTLVNGVPVENETHISINFAGAR